MDIDYAIKIVSLIGTVSSAIATWKIFSELLRNKKEGVREEYKFARDFLSETRAEDIHPYISQLGYLALSGDPTADSEGIRHVLSMKNPKTALRHYLSGKSCLDFYATSSPPGFAFKATYKSSTKRLALKLWYVSCYFVTYMASVSPILLVSFRQVSAGVGLPLFLFTAVTFGPLVYLSLRGGSKFRGAEALIDWQRKCGALDKAT